MPMLRSLTTHITLYLSAWGRLRSLLILLVVLTVLFAPDPKVRAVIEWPLIVPTLIAPAIAPLLLMVVMLDLMMAKILLIGNEPSAERQERTRRIVLTHLVAVAALVYTYLPFFLALAR